MYNRASLDCISGDWDPARPNNLDFIRFLLATLVLIEHSHLLLTGSLATDPLFAFSHGATNTGEVAVNGFFTLSGFLLARSWQGNSTSGVLAFALRRLRRIFPGYAAAALICCMVIGPVFSAWHGLSWFRKLPPSLIVLRIFLLRRIDGPGFGTLTLFAQSGQPLHLNLSTWTIPIEAGAYALCAALGANRLLTAGKRNWVLLLLAVDLVTVATVRLQLTNHVVAGMVSLAGELAVPSPLSLEWPRLFACFLAGIAFWLFHESIPRSGVLALFSVLPLALSRWLGPLTSVLLPLGGAYLLLYLALPRRPMGLEKWRDMVGGDYSYGLYLWGWPVGQLLVQYAGGVIHGSATGLFFATLLLAVPIAALSWRLVERPFVEPLHLRALRASSPT